MKPIGEDPIAPASVPPGVFECLVATVIMLSVTLTFVTCASTVQYAVGGNLHYFFVRHSVPLHVCDGALVCPLGYVVRAFPAERASPCTAIPVLCIPFAAEAPADLVIHPTVDMWPATAYTAATTSNLLPDGMEQVQNIDCGLGGAVLRVGMPHMHPDGCLVGPGPRKNVTRQYIWCTMNSWE
jgi:hypothetical protein